MSNSSIDEITFKHFISDPENENFKIYTKTYGFFRAFEKLEFEDIHLTNIDIYEKDIVFDSSIFHSINIEGATFKNKLWFKNCIFRNELIIHDGSIRHLMFINCEFEENFTIYNLNADVLTLDNCVSKSPTLIKGGEYKNLSYYSSNEKTHLRIDGFFTFINYLKISTLIGATISISECIVNLLEISGDFNSSSRLNIKDIRNNEVLIKHLNNDGKFYFSTFRVCFSKLRFAESLTNYINFIKDEALKSDLLRRVRYNPEIRNFTQLYNNISTTQDEKNALYYNVHNMIIDKDESIDHQFTVKYSSLGILEVKKLDLKSYNITILTSDLSSIKLINTTFPTDQKSWTYSDGFSVFTDLYSSANRQNNISDKIEYYKTAQKFLYKKISSEKFSFQKYGSLIAIKASQIYSNHGSNWIKAFVITFFGIAIPMFGLFVFSLEKISFDLSEKGFEYFRSEILPYFPQFISPIHKIEFMESISSLGKYSSWIDMFSRVFIGIGIFEMIRSFRKFIRN